ncbi:MAG TPA: hypothetical protein G4O02_07395 [Caldilineae bacterium]|nr:hypothetical protein [Caldilineae bacterium]
MTEILIDGDNLAGWLAKRGYLAHRRDDEGLMRLLRRWQRQALAKDRDHWVTLVLDPGPNRDHSSHRDQIWVTIPEDGGTADGLLLDMIEEDLVMGRSLSDAVVVTSDSNLREQLKALGVRVIDVPRFTRRLLRGLPPPSEKPVPGAPGFEDVERELLARAMRPRRRRRRVDAAALQDALGRLASADANERIEAARQLAALPDRRSAMALTEALRDPNARVRAEAARSLGRLGYRRLTRAALIQRLEDTDAGVRAAAATALGMLKDSWAIPTLRHLAETDGTAQVRRAAWEALRRISETLGPEAFFG